MMVLVKVESKEPNRESRFCLRLALVVALHSLATPFAVSAQTKITFEQDWTKLIAVSPAKSTPSPTPTPARCVLGRSAEMDY
jgi:hypothetical protein